MEKEDYKSLVPKSGGGEEGTEELVDTYLKITPGQPISVKDLKAAAKRYTKLLKFKEFVKR